MASKTPANHGKHTPSELVRERIIAHLKIGPCKRASAIGYAAYPDYTFRNRQGAAFAVQRHLQQLVKDGIVAWNGDDIDSGYYLVRANPTNDDR
ncbi:MULTISPECIES: hypothetical protein [Aeromonas]|uniref:hypothetical protein n=1 Tax=Aeromonas TaxID=642 RepID=UPI002B05AB1D|nr:hypothetical protein [Aeromonas jandaei]